MPLILVLYLLETAQTEFAQSWTFAIFPFLAGCVVVDLTCRVVCNVLANPGFSATGMSDHSGPAHGLVVLV